MDKALRQWGETQPLKGTLAERYLTNTRRRDPSDVDDLRFHPKIYINKIQHHPCLVAAIRNVHSGMITGIQRTFIDRITAAKIDRKMQGTIRDGVVMLDPHDAPTYGLAITEGLEDGLAIREFHRPVWVCLSAGTMAHMPALAGIEALTIYPDADKAGQDAARRCAKSWYAVGAEVVIRTPIGGKDPDEVMR